MKQVFLRAMAILSLVALPLAGAAEPSTLGLVQALILAEKVSPDLKAAQSREMGSREAVRAARSGLLPSLDLAAVDSTGFPGSASGLSGFNGIVASPYRQGAAADAFGQWDLVDTSVWHNVAAANFEVSASHEFTRIQRAQVDQQSLRIYLEAVMYRGERDAWQTLEESLKGVRDTVVKYVRNGQYSEVQRMLIEDQLDEAELNQDDFDRRYRSVLLRLGFLTGVDAADVACPPPAGLSEADLQAIQMPDGESPIVLRASAEAKSAEEITKRYDSENLPKIKLGASAGYLEGSRLVDSQDYSAFAGITVPIFEGFKISAQTGEAAQEEDAKNQEVIQAKLELEDLNARFDDQVDEARMDLNRLLPEETRAASAVDLARSRYLAFLGPLSDLQQALKDRVNADIQIADVKTRLLLAIGSKAFVNGGTITQAQ